mmetsp:Transcript_14257/g.38666  ORF Transcript_14257/g.38666 Transcript_14257/m.38666 type:complete len:215 (+) Transcript_14257:983-1627(+)
MGHGACKQCLACPRWAVQKDTLWLCYAQAFKKLWVLEGQLNHLFDLLDLLISSSNHVIGGVRHVLHLHEADQGVHLGGEQKVQGVAVVFQGNTSASRQLRHFNVLVDVHHVLALGVRLHEHLVLAHDLDDLPHIGSRLLQQLQLLPQQTDLRVQLIPLGFQPLQVQALVLHLKLKVFYLRLVVTSEPIAHRGLSPHSHNSHAALSFFPNYFVPK